MSWIDKLSDHGSTKVKVAKRARLPKPVVHEVYVTVRHSSGSDPGAIDVGHYYVQDGVVHLCDADGRELKEGPRTHELGDLRPDYVAQLLLRQRRSEKGADFWRPIPYPDGPRVA
jgi:hypothetical protein